MNPLELILKRHWYTKKSTMGVLSISGNNWFTLEDPVRKIKVEKITAIPASRYKIVPQVSYTVKEIRPMLLDVPNYYGVFIHVGNHPENTEGCILPGKNKGDDYIFDSGKAYREICGLLCNAWIAHRDTWITIEDLDGHMWFDDFPVA